MKKTLIYAIVIAGLIALSAFAIMRTKKIAQPEEQPPVVPGAAESTPAAPGESVEASIDRELQGIDLGDLEKEFQAIDKDLKSL